MASSSHVRDARQEAILAAATAVLTRQGFCETHMEDIAQEAGLSKRALTHAFRSKGLLIAGMLHHFYDQGLHDLHLSEASAAPASRQILLLTRYMVAGLEHLAVLLPMTHVSTARPSCQEEVRACLSEYFHGYRRALVPLIQRGVEQRELSPVDPEAAATMLASLYEGQAMLWAEDPTSARWEHISEQIIQTFLAGLQVNA